MPARPPVHTRGRVSIRKLCPAFRATREFDHGQAEGGRVDVGLEVDFQTLSGLDVAIREGASCGGEIVLEGTVTDADIEA